MLQLMERHGLNAVQKRRLYVDFFAFFLVGALVLISFTVELHVAKESVYDNWDSYLLDPLEQALTARELSIGATEVEVGTYVENIRELNLRDSYYRVEFMVWFSWRGDAELNPAGKFRIYKGVENKKVILDEIHEGDLHYQLVGMDVSVSKSFDTKRFPLESYQLRFYVESTDPIQKVVFVADQKNSGMNRNITLTGFDFTRYGLGETSFSYESTHGNPKLDGSETTAEIVTMFEITRSDTGLYFKCFIALFCAVLWALIWLFVCAYHGDAHFNLLPGALFGAVSNILIGADLLPGPLETGLLEYANLWGVLSIMGISIAMVKIVRVGRTMCENPRFVQLYGGVLFGTMLGFSVIGQIALPLAASFR